LPVAQCAVTCVAFSPDGGLLAAGSLDQSFRIWDLSPAEPCERARFIDTQGGVRQIVFPPDEPTLVTIEDKGRASVWDVLAETRLREWAVPIAKTYSFALTFDGRYVATGTSDGHVLVYRIASRRKAE
jgi:WD40 repeat protein